MYIFAIENDSIHATVSPLELRRALVFWGTTVGLTQRWEIRVRIPGRGKCSLRTIAVDARVTYLLFNILQMLEEYGDDIRFSEEQIAAMASRKGIGNTFQLWPNGVLYYKFEDNREFVVVDDNGYMLQVRRQS